MNENKTEDEKLKKALNAWRVTGALPPRFQERVWSRIEQVESVQTPSIWEQISGWANQVFARPAVAVGYVSALLMAGLIVGHVKASSAERELQGELATRYVQSVNPYLKMQP